MAEAKVKVRLDTRQAKGDLRGLTRSASRAGGRVASQVRGAIGKGIGAVGLGGAVGAGIAAVRGATSSGIGDILGETLGGIGAQLNEFLFGDIDDDARASKSAREEVIQAYGAIAGKTGVIPPGAKNYFEAIKTLRLDQEKGRSMFEDPDNGFRAESPIADMVDRIMTKLGTLLSEAVDALGEKIRGFFTFK